MTNEYDKTSFYKWIIELLGGIIARLKDMTTDQPQHDNVWARQIAGHERGNLDPVPGACSHQPVSYTLKLSGTHSKTTLNS